MLTPIKVVDLLNNEFSKLEDSSNERLKLPLASTKFLKEVFVSTHPVNLVL